MKLVIQVFIFILTLLTRLSLIACSGSPTVTSTQTSTFTQEDTTTLETPTTTVPTTAHVNSTSPLLLEPTPLPLAGWEKFHQDNMLSAVWGSSTSDVFFVGAKGTILHYNGVSWDSMDTGVFNELNDVWGTSSKDVFAVGDRGIILHYDGNDWSLMPSGTDEHLTYVGGSSPEDVIAVTYKSSILVYDGTSWHTRETLSGGIFFWGIWASSSSQIFAVTVGSALIEGYYFLYFNGVGWLPMKCEAVNDSLLCIWGSSPTDVYAGGNNVIVHFDGKDWSTATDFPTAAFAGWANSPSDVIAVGAGGIIKCYDGEGWRLIETGQDNIWDVWGSIHSEIFTVNKDVTILHYISQ